MRFGVVVAAAAVVLVMAPVAATAAPRITEPTGRTPVVAGQAVVVRGEGCPAGSRVVLAPRLFAVRTTTTAGPNGAFVASMTLPATLYRPAGTGSTVEISGTCGGQVIPTVVLAGGPTRMPFTGAPVAPLLAIGLVLLVAGAVTTVAAGRS